MQQPFRPRRRFAEDDAHFRQQFGEIAIRQAVIIAANSRVGIDQHKLRTMCDGSGSVERAIFDGQFETIFADSPEVLAPSGKKLPMCVVGRMPFGIFVQSLRRIVLRVDADADESHTRPIGPAARMTLQRSNSLGLLRTGRLALSEHEVHDPDVSAQFVCPKHSAVLVDQFEFRSIE